MSYRLLKAWIAVLFMVPPRVGAVDQRQRVNPLTAVPITITAKEQVVNVNEREMVFSGSVVLIQNQLTIKADKLTLFRTTPSNDQLLITASGNPVHFEDVRDHQTIRGSSKQLTYEVDSQILELTEAVMVKQMNHQLTAYQVRYDLAKNSVIASSHPESLQGNVTMVLDIDDSSLEGISR